MINKKSGVFFAVLILGLFSMAFASAGSCSIKTLDSCSSYKNAIMGLYGTSNTHGASFPTGISPTSTGGAMTGAAITGSYPFTHVLCCNFEGSKDCTGTNKILGLYSILNSHAESPSESTYSNDVCFDDLECISTNNPDSKLSEYPVKMLSLSSETNAHLGTYSLYPYKILCKRSKEAYWMNSDFSQELEEITVQYGETIDLNMVLNPVEGESVTISVYESDTNEATTGGSAGVGSSLIFTSIIQDVLDYSGSPITGNAVGYGGEPNAFYEKLTIDSSYLDSLGEEEDKRYELYFKAETSSGEWVSDIIYVNVLDSGIQTFWMNPSTGEIITQVNYDGTPFEVSMVLKDSGLGASGANFEVYELDNTRSSSASGEDYTSVPKTSDKGEVLTSITANAISSGDIGASGTSILPDNSIVELLTVNNELLIEMGPEEDGRYEFYFKVNDDDSMKSGILYVYAEDITGEANAYWMKKDLSQVLTTYTIQMADDFLEVALVVDNSGLPEGPISLEVKERDTGLLNSDDSIRTVTGNVNSEGRILALWQMTEEDFEAAGSESDKQYEFYFEYGSIESSILTITYDESILIECTGVGLCMDYIDEAVCNADPCNVASDSAPLDINCEDPFLGCGCSWNSAESVCAPSWSAVSPTGSSVGTCKYLEDTQGDDCQDGFLSYSWSATWEWAEGNTLSGEISGAGWIYDDNTGSYHYDPEGASKKCIGGSNIIPCPAQIQLSFFNIVNLISALVLLAVVYYLIRSNKKNIKKKK